MYIIILIIAAFIIFRFPIVRYLVLHPVRVIKNALIDLYKYFRYKRYNICPEYGKIRLNSAKGSQVFGCGKTLSLVRQANFIYKKYNNLDVWDEEEKKFVKQKIHIISNVALKGIPYIPWEGTEQFINIDKMGFDKQDITIYLLDEAGTIFNSRKFRDNISMEFLTRLLQSRKNKMALYMTSQRFQFTDKILRETCSTVTTCRKIWRFIELCDYDAFEVENATNVELLQPISTRVWFSTDKFYKMYDTSQLIEQLKKDNENGDLLNTEEVLATYGDTVPNLDMVTHRKKKFTILPTVKH